MANEITITVKADYAFGDVTSTFKAAESLNIDANSNQIARLTQSIGLAYETLDAGNTAESGGAMFVAVNRSTTDIVTLRLETGGGDVAQMAPGEPCCFRVAGDTAISAKASGSAAILEYQYFGSYDP